MKKNIKKIINFFNTYVYFGVSIKKLKKIYFNKNFIVFFPYTENTLGCGIVSIVSYNNKKKVNKTDKLYLDEKINNIYINNFLKCREKKINLINNYFGGEKLLKDLKQYIINLKNKENFYNIYMDEKLQKEISDVSKRISYIIKDENHIISQNIGYLSSDETKFLFKCIDTLKDIFWCLSCEIKENIEKIKNIIKKSSYMVDFSCFEIFNKINTVLNSIDRLEVRGRDSAGITLMFVFKKEEFKVFEKKMNELSLIDQYNKRLSDEILINNSININTLKDLTTITFTYKIAAEIGNLGDNVNFIRKKIKEDSILQIITFFKYKYFNISAHTRWASIGSINNYNCHPLNNRLDNKTSKNIKIKKSGIIHVCLNGDIDNYIDLKKDNKKKGYYINKEITTDTKIIPVQIQNYYNDGFDIEEAFRLAVNDFKGSHAITMHTDLAPGKFFLAQRGSGQAIFVGLSEDKYLPTSEVYGFIEETSRYIKIDGEKRVNGNINGQIFILNQDSSEGLEGIKALFYDGTPISLTNRDIKHTDITSRDIDRQDYPHYFLKEISESPASIEKTLINRWKIDNKDKEKYIINLNEKEFPDRLENCFKNNKIKKIYFIGQGTAGIAATVCSDILNYYLNKPCFQILSARASEFSGFILNESDYSNIMEDTLVIAISQSGTTTDTNRAVDMVKERGAHTLAIVNRRDSDITFKVDGVIYTSSGRDIEMSVASTKAFYSQIIAGAVLGLNIAEKAGYRADYFITQEIRQLLKIPDIMRKILFKKKEIEKSAKKTAGRKIYWAAVGSGPNKASADEIRIKLSELCYKTISSDYVEDKKHIDLSSEPLIIVCAAGTREAVIGDIIKDVAIFKAHKATPIIIADEGEERFYDIAEDVFNVPVVSEHLAPIVNTLVGHIWGYYAALTINEGSKFLNKFREELRVMLDNYNKEGLDIYEVILENSFREKIAVFYNKFRKKKSENILPVIFGIENALDLTLLLKYLSGRLPVSDFEIDFGKKGTAKNMMDVLFNCLDKSINSMARPVDAIKHQAKTVTVGTSRSKEEIGGIIFDLLTLNNLKTSQITNSNIIVIRNLQNIVSEIPGYILYRISGLSILGTADDKTQINVLKKEGVLKPIPSRIETDKKLKGTKKIIVRQGNVYIGKGRKDSRSIIIIPVISDSPLTPNVIEYLLLLNISFKETVPLKTKIKALGGKYEHIKNIVLENNIMWEDKNIELVDMVDLFGKSAEKTGEFIVSRLK